MTAHRDSTARRTRYASMTTVLVAGISIALLFVAVLAARFHARWDATATRDHSLSSTTRQVLLDLSAPVEIVASIDPSRMDVRSRQRVGDVLAAFATTSDKVRLTTIDVGRPEAAEQIDGVAARSLARHTEALSRHRAAVADVRAALAEIQADAPRVADGLEGAAQLKDARFPARERLLESAALLRGLVGDAERADTAVTAAVVRVGTNDLPDLEGVRAAAGPVLQTVATTTDRASVASGDMEAGARGAIAAAGVLRDRALRVTDALERLEPLEPLMIARLLRERPAVLVVTESGVQAIDQQSLFPTSAKLDAAGASAAQIAFAGEEIIAGAIRAAHAGNAPVLVLVHAEREAMLDTKRRPTPSGARIARMVERLSGRGIDIAEWAVAKDAARPNLTSIDRERRRPVVWFVLGAPSRAGENTRTGQGSDRAAHVRSLAAAAESLVNSGEHLLFAMEPSELPAIGEADPMVSPLRLLGVSVDTARPLIERLPSPGNPAFSAYQTIRNAESGSEVGRSIGAMATTLHWPMPIRADSPLPEGVTVAPLLKVEGSANRWAESQWLGLRYLNVAQPLKAITPRDPPIAGDRDDAQGPWTVAMAIERVRGQAEPVAGEGRTQRVIVVASPSWYEDMYTELATMVEGRRAAVLPGNRELVEASVLWLAGLGDRLKGERSAGDVARIAALSPAALAGLRWGVMAGMPLGVLAIGLFLRWRADRLR